jgi:long-chain acyl-CoA synthetase
VFTNSLNYYLACFYFNTFPIPQREAGARHTLKYIGEVTGSGMSILLFPEGVRSPTGQLKPFRGGIGMIGARLHLPIVPVRIEGVDRVLHPSWKMARPGPCSVTFGTPIHLTGDDYAALARRVEEAVRNLPVAVRRDTMKDSE